MPAPRVNGRFVKATEISPPTPTPTPTPAPAASPPTAENHSPASLVGQPETAPKTAPTEGQTTPTASPANAATEAAPAPRKRRGRPPGSGTRPPGTIPGQPPQHINGDLLGGPQSPTTAPTPDRYAQTGAILTDAFIGACVAVFGNEWLPKDNDERNNLASAATSYCRAKQLPDLPPGFVLLGAVAMYALPRLNLPATKSKLQTLTGRLRGGKNQGGSSAVHSEA